MSFGAESLDPDNKQILATSKNTPTAVALTRYFTPGETIALDYNVNSTGAQGSQSEIKTTYRLVGKEQVTVEAGTFDACKIEFTLDMRTNAAGALVQTQKSGFIWSDARFGMVKEEFQGSTVVDAFGFKTTTEQTDYQELLKADMGGEQRP